MGYCLLFGYGWVGVGVGGWLGKKRLVVGVGGSSGEFYFVDGDCIGGWCDYRVFFECWSGY